MWGFLSWRGGGGGGRGCVQNNLVPLIVGEGRLAPALCMLSSKKIRLYCRLGGGGGGDTM